METQRKIPLGIDDYRVVSEECYYVDKTLLIKDIANLPDGSVTLFTRPRRFGKSLTVSMLATFFDSKEKDAKRYFDDKKIAKETEYALLGASPVIYISLKDLHSSNYDDLFMQTFELIRREYLRHDELARDDALNEDNKAYYDAIIKKDFTSFDLSDALYCLSAMLHDYYGSKVCLFIDEYDTPIQAGHDNWYYDEAISFFRLLYGKALKGNYHLKTAVLTGVLRIAKESLFSGLNNLIVDNGYDSAFPEYFGFTKDEASALIKYFGAKHSFEELWSWYGGYHFGDEAIMNPWSLLSYFRYKMALKEYWVNTSSVSILASVLKEHHFSYYEILGSLLNGDKVHIKPNFSTSYADLNESVDKFLGFLVATGYLTYDRESEDVVAIPNHETALAMREEILERFKSNDAISAISSIKHAIMAADADAFASLLKRVLLHSFSYFDFQQERSYQAMTLTLVSLLFDDYIVKSEVLEGEGRCDIMIQSRTPSSFGAIIEIKHVKSKTSEERLHDRARAALKQIKEKNYAEDLILHGAKPILAYGIAFFQKKAVVEVEKIRA